MASTTTRAGSESPMLAVSEASVGSTVVAETTRDLNWRSTLEATCLECVATKTFKAFGGGGKDLFSMMPLLTTPCHGGTTPSSWLATSHSSPRRPAGGIGRRPSPPR